MKDVEIFYVFGLGVLGIVVLFLIFLWVNSDSNQCPNCKRRNAKSKITEVARESDGETHTHYNTQEKKMITTDRSYDFVTYQFTCKHCQHTWTETVRKNQREQEY